MNLKTLAALQEKATKGPWEQTAHLGPTGHGGIAICSSRQDYNVACVYLQMTNTKWKWDEQCFQPENAEALGTAKFIEACGSFDFTALCDEMERMRKALEYYSDLALYEGVSLGVAPINDDRGNKAREALGGKDE